MNVQHGWEYDWIFSPRARLPTFSTNCLDGSHFAQMGSQFAQNPNPNPCSLLSRHTPFWDIYVHNTHPTPKTVNPFFWTKLESGQTELPSGQTGPQLGNMFEKRQNFSISGQKSLLVMRMVTWTARISGCKRGPLSFSTKLHWWRTFSFRVLWWPLCCCAAD